MAYHVMVLTQQELNEGKLRIPELLSDTITRRMMQIPRQVQAGVVRHDHVEVLSLGPLKELCCEIQREYGQSAHSVLFFNDAARKALEMYKIEADFTATIKTSELPDDLDVALQIEHFYVVAT
jgi:hypothetical protein